jgi:hypothetical protein
LFRRATNNIKSVSSRLWTVFSVLTSSILFKCRPSYRPFAR